MHGVGSWQLPGCVAPHTMPDGRRGASKGNARRVCATDGVYGTLHSCIAMDACGIIRDLQFFRACQGRWAPLTAPRLGCRCKQCSRRWRRRRQRRRQRLHQQLACSSQAVAWRQVSHQFWSGCVVGCGLRAATDPDLPNDHRRRRSAGGIPRCCPPPPDVTPDLLVTSARAFSHALVAVAGRSGAQPLFHELPHPTSPTQRLRSLHAAGYASRGVPVT